MKAKYAVVIFLFVGTSLGGIGWAIHYNSYEAGKSASNKEWEAKWVNRYLTDKSTQLVQERALRNRDRGLEIETKTEEIVRNAETDKYKMLLVGSVDCSQISTINSQPVEQVSF